MLSSAENPGTENLNCCTAMEQQEVVRANSGTAAALFNKLIIFIRFNNRTLEFIQRNSKLKYILNRANV